MYICFPPCVYFFPPLGFSEAYLRLWSPFLLSLELKMLWAVCLSPPKGLLTFSRTADTVWAANNVWVEWFLVCIAD